MGWPLDSGHRTGTRVVLGGLVVAGLACLLCLDALRRSHLGLGVLMTLAVSGALAEFYVMAERLGNRPLRGLGVAGGALLTAAHWWWLQTGRKDGLDPMPLVSLLVLAGSFTGLMLRPARERRMEDLALTLLGVLYLWLPLSFGMRLRVEPWAASGLAGHAAFVFAMAAGKGSDIGAFFVGSRLGRHPLAPVISPRKTWEGLAGAAMGGAAFGWLVARLWPELPASCAQAAALGAVIGPAGQFADLWKSLLKRQAGVKDSGTLLPALGGILDMVDSLVLAMPVAYYGLLLLHAGWGLKGAA